MFWHKHYFWDANVVEENGIYSKILILPLLHFGPLQWSDK